jgi:hypothetical protein
MAEDRSSPRTAMTMPVCGPSWRAAMNARSDLVRIPPQPAPDPIREPAVSLVLCVTVSSRGQRGAIETAAGRTARRHRYAITPPISLAPPMELGSGARSPDNHVLEGDDSGRDSTDAPARLMKLSTDVTRYRGDSTDAKLGLC